MKAVFMTLSLFVSFLCQAQFTEIKKLVAQDQAASDNFGFSVAIDGDIAIVGAYLDDDRGSSSGSVYIYARNQGGVDNWGVVKKLTAFDGRSSDLYGETVGISGDIAVVGAPRDDDNGSASGSVYLYMKDLGGVDNWGFLKKITAFDGATLDEFSEALFIKDDLLAVGVPKDDDNSSSSGSVYLYEKNQGGANNWGFLKKLTASDGMQEDAFGNSISINNDLIAVGAWGVDLGDFNFGAAYIFSKDLGGTNNWGELKKIVAPDGAPSDFFGDVSLFNDVLLVGAEGNDEVANGAGAAYIFYKDLGGIDNWGFHKKLVPDDLFAFGAFGRHVTSGEDRIIIGLHFGENPDGLNTGIAYIFERDEGGADNWGERQKIFASDGQFSSSFGSALGLWNDHLIVGSWAFDGIGTNSGAAYIFENLTLCNVDDIEVSLDTAGFATIDTSDLTIVNFGSHDTVYISKSGFDCDDLDFSPLVDSLIGISGMDTTICTFSVTILDTIPPLITCQPDSIYLLESGSVSVNPLLFTTLEDNCIPQGVFSSPNTFTCADVGQQNVEVILFDQSGNRDTCEAIINVFDTITPVISCRDTILDMPEVSMISLEPADLLGSFTDNCAIDSLYLDQYDFACAFADATFQVEVSVIDVNNNTSFCLSQITLTDTHGYCCPDSLTVTGQPIDTTDYFASISICGSGNIQSNTTVNFNSLNVKLDTSFQVDPGGEMQVNIEDCNN